MENEPLNAVSLLCRMCHREKKMISLPDNYTCSILCQKLRRGEITKEEWYRYQTTDIGDFKLPDYRPCTGFNKGIPCRWQGAWGATGILPPGHCRIRGSDRIQELCHDGLPFPPHEDGKWVVLSGEWIPKVVNESQ